MSASRVSAIEESAWFQSKWAPYQLADADWRIRAVNSACERVSGHPREDLLGHHLFDVFPDNPADPDADGVANVSASLELVFRRGVRHWMGVQRYDLPDRQHPGEFIYRVWTPMNSPIKDGKKTVAVLQHAQDVTRVVPPTPEERAYPKLFELRRAADALGRQFPDLPPRRCSACWRIRTASSRKARGPRTLRAPRRWQSCGWKRTPDTPRKGTDTGLSRPCATRCGDDSPCPRTSPRRPAAPPR